MVKNFSELCSNIFDECIKYYHTMDNVDANPNVPYKSNTIEHSLFIKNWIDAVQWHLEDLIRDPNINPEKALLLKRRIDKSNQDRTDLVEQIDSYFLEYFKDVRPQNGATINTESPAWAVDRLSILALKIYHMEQEVSRANASADHVATCRQKLTILLEQRKDLSMAIDQLLDDIANGRKYMKVYRQMKMYNDPSLNPILYGKNETNP